MRSPAFAIMGQVWRRYWLGLTLCASAWLVATGAAAILGVVYPDGLLRPPHPHSAFPPVFLFFVIPLCASGAAVIGYFSFVSESRFELRDSCYPARAFLLPVTSATLAFWPMLQAALVAAGFWVAWAVAVFR